MWSITPYPTCPQLSPFIQFYWIGTVTPGDVLPVSFLPPTGFTSILLQHGKNPLQLRNYGGKPFTVSKAVIMGQYFNSLEATIPDDFDIIGVMFKPSVLHRFFGFNMQEFTHALMNADDVFGYDILNLVDRIGNSKTNPERLTHIDNYFMRKFRQVKFETTLVDHAIEIMIEKQGNVKVSELAKYFNFTPRLLQKKFNDATGISPKYLSRIVQFNNVLATLKSNPKIKWADLALASGYYDQAHLVNTFIEFTGTSPVQYKEENNEITKFYLDDTLE